MKNVLFLVGPHASGKTYSTRELINRKELQDTIMIDTGPIMRKLHKESSPNTTIDMWVESLEKQHGKNITSKLISQEIGRIFAKTECNNCILIGFRSLKGIIYTIEELNIDNYNILYVDASFELLYKNYISREEKNITKPEFDVYIQDELNSGLGVLKNIALNNNQLIDYYYRESNEDNFENIILKYIEPDKPLIKRRKQK